MTDKSCISIKKKRKEIFFESKWSIIDFYHDENEAYNQQHEGPFLFTSYSFPIPFQANFDD